MQSETVESIVTKYLEEWGYTYAQTKHAITHNFAMDPREIQRALVWLDEMYKPEKVDLNDGKWMSGDIPDGDAD